MINNYIWLNNNKKALPRASDKQEVQLAHSSLISAKKQEVSRAQSKKLQKVLFRKLIPDNRVFWITEFRIIGYLLYL